MTPSQPAVRDRYGRPAQRRRRWTWALLALPLVGVLAWLGYSAVVWSTPGADAGVVRWQSLSPSRVSITVRVHRTAGRRAACTLFARGANGAEVAHEQVTAPASAADQVELTRVLHTTARAVTGEVRDCHLLPR